MPTDDDLTTALRSSVPESPAGPDVAALWLESRRRRHRRQILAGVTATVLVFVAAAGAYAFTDDDVSVDVGPAATDSQQGTSQGNCTRTMQAYLRDTTDVVVYLQPQVSADQIVAVTQRLESEPEVASVALVGQDEVYRQFSELFADTPQIVETVTPDILPPYLEIDLSTGVEADGFVTALTASGEPEIREVVSRDEVGAKTDCRPDNGASDRTTTTLETPADTEPSAPVVITQTSTRWSPGEISFHADGSITVDGYDDFVEREQPAFSDDAAQSASALLGIDLDEPGTVFDVAEVDVDTSTVTVTTEIDDDDSVSGSRQVLDFANIDGTMHFLGGTWSTRCARGHDAGEFVVAQICP